MLILYTLRFCFCIIECTVVMVTKCLQVEKGDNSVNKHFPGCFHKKYIDMNRVWVHLTCLHHYCQQQNHCHLTHTQKSSSGSLSLLLSIAIYQKTSSILFCRFLAIFLPRFSYNHTDCCSTKCQQFWKGSKLVNPALSV